MIPFPTETVSSLQIERNGDFPLNFSNLPVDKRREFWIHFTNFQVPPVYIA